ncbi:MAG TPA: ABC transporter permease [Gemmatimonadales bacterium]|nr:ABC transporter permease [Gemmatimonadales bacterium]
MAGWALRRLLQALATFAASLLIIFVIMRVAPGDPLVRLESNTPLDPAEVRVLRQRFGLDQPFTAQLGNWLGGALRGDFGTSIGHYPETVGRLLSTRLPASLILGGTVFLLNFTVGVWLGVLQARHRGERLDRWLTRGSVALYAMPAFWLGLMLIALLSLEWRIFPSAQMHDPFIAPEAPFVTRLMDVLRHLVLPAITLSAVTIAGTMRLQRTAMIQTLREDYVRAARARGLEERRVVWKHAWRNALFPVITLFGLSLPVLVTGAVFVEYVFNWPGLGGLAADAISGRDYPLLMGCAMLVTGAVILGGVITDFAQHALDPRTRPG